MRLSMVEYNENSYTLRCNSGGPVFLKLAETEKLLVDFFYLGFFPGWSALGGFSGMSHQLFLKNSWPFSLLNLDRKDSLHLFCFVFDVHFLSKINDYSEPLQYLWAGEYTRE